ncbi:MAG: hypothetical protein QW733_07745 [Desulfurococcaceae archaeon]
MVYAWAEDGHIFAVERLEDVPEQYRNSVVVFEDLTAKDVSKLYIDDGEIRVKDEQMLVSEKREEVKRLLIDKAEKFITETLKKHGYYSLGDLLVYAQSGSQEAIELLSWYKQFDAKVWDFIETQLGQKSLQELESFDIDSFLNNIATEAGNV